MHAEVPVITAGVIVWGLPTTGSIADRAIAAARGHRRPGGRRGGRGDLRMKASAPRRGKHFPGWPSFLLQFVSRVMDSGTTRGRHVNLTRDRQRPGAFGQPGVQPQDGGPGGPADRGRNFRDAAAPSGPHSPGGDAPLGRIREGIARALAVPQSKFAWAMLTRCYRDEADKDSRLRSRFPPTMR